MVQKCVGQKCRQLENEHSTMFFVVIQGQLIYALKFQALRPNISNFSQKSGESFKIWDSWSLKLTKIWLFCLSRRKSVKTHLCTYICKIYLLWILWFFKSCLIGSGLLKFMIEWSKLKTYIITMNVSNTTKSSQTIDFILPWIELTHKIANWLC